MDQDIDRDALEQIKALLAEQLKMQELILHRLDSLERLIGAKQ